MVRVERLHDPDGSAAADKMSSTAFSAGPPVACRRAHLTARVLSASALTHQVIPPRLAVSSPTR
jgi:hypothetical protein